MSTTLVAIQLAGGQYSHRIVRVFIRSRLTHVTLGTFLATFVFALNGLVEVREGNNPLVPALTVSVVYLLLLATLAMFVTFLHGMSKMLRVQYLLSRVTNEGRAAVLHAFPRPTYTSSQRRRSTMAKRCATVPGRCAAVGGSSHWVRQAASRGVRAELLVEVGEYVAARHRSLASIAVSPSR